MGRPKLHAGSCSADKAHSVCERQWRIRLPPPSSRCRGGYDPEPVALRNSWQLRCVWRSGGHPFAPRGRRVTAFLVITMSPVAHLFSSRVIGAKTTDSRRDCRLVTLATLETRADSGSVTAT